MVIATGYRAMTYPLGMNPISNDITNVLAFRKASCHFGYGFSAVLRVPLWLRLGASMKGLLDWGFPVRHEWIRIRPNALSTVSTMLVLLVNDVIKLHYFWHGVLVGLE
jgi:hypothetical protein